MQARLGQHCWTIRRILELWDKQGMELIFGLSHYFGFDFLFLFFWNFPLSPLPRWGRQGTLAGPAIRGSNGLRMDESGDSDQAGVENGDQGHGLGL